MRAFLGAVFVLTRRPELIKRLFEIKSSNLNLFGVWIFLQGEWSLVSLDKLFPIAPGNNGRSLFSNIKTPQFRDIWL